MTGDYPVVNDCGLPWTSQGIFIAAHDADYVVATTLYGERVSVESAFANAAFIVRACNAHEELLAACKKVVEHFGDPAQGQLFRLRAAIAKAEGRS